MKSFAIILASGSGTRYGDRSIPKHLLKVSGVPIIIWTLNSVINSNIFDKVIVVTKKEYLKSTMSSIKDYFNLSKINLSNTIGGNERMQSFFNGITTITSNFDMSELDTLALIDANRPFCSKEQLIELNNLAKKNGCSCPARPIINGVAKIHGQEITEVPKKDDFVEFVTPEIIRYDLYKKAIKNSKYTFRSLVEYSLLMKVNPSFILSSDLNSKLTYPEDLVYLEKLVNKYNLSL